MQFDGDSLLAGIVLECARLEDITVHVFAEDLKLP
jgi:hypothetical protein